MTRLLSDAVPVLLCCASFTQMIGGWLLYHFATIGIDWHDVVTARKRRLGFGLQVVGAAIDLLAGLIWFFSAAKWG